MYEGDRKILASQQPVIELRVGGGRSWLDEFETPWWLVGGRDALYLNEWRIVDNSERDPIRLNWTFPLYCPITKKITHLTDPENEGLLEVAQRICIALRAGHLRRIDSASAQVHITRRIMLIFAWMRLNFKKSIDQLTPYDFRHFMKIAPWGIVRILDVESRLNEYIDSLMTSGKKFLQVEEIKNKNSRKKYSKIDVWETYRQLGIDQEFSNLLGKNFLYQFWNAVAKINGPELVPHRHKKFLEEEEPDREAGAKNVLRKYVEAWQALYDAGYILPQKSAVDPQHDFVKGERMTSSRIAREVIAAADLENDEGITETIPDRQAFHIINQACRWVVTYADDLLELRKQGFEMVSDLPTRMSRTSRISTLLKGFKPQNITVTQPGAPWPLIVSASSKDILGRNLTVDEATCSFLMAACVIVIGAFTARRRIEVLTIKGGEPIGSDRVPRALYIDEFGKPWMWSFIEKTFQRWDRTPIPQVVVKAIEVLEMLTESTREKTGTRKLFEAEVINRQSLFKLKIVEGINLFADFVQVPLLEDGTKWVFKPHQFRRFFALLYMYRFNHNDHGKMEALSYQLRHFNMEMTKRYIEEIYESDMLKAYSRHVVVDLMSGVLSGERKALGPGGAAMKKHLDEMLHEVVKDSEVLSGRENPVVARKIAERVMDKLKVDMVPFKWGFCYAYKAADSGEYCGNCIAENDKADKPNVAQATPKKCLGCNHLYVDENFRVLWELGAKSYRASAEKGCYADILTQYAMEYAEVYEEGMRTYFGVEPEDAA